MDSPSGVVPSLLEYARHFGIAEDPSSITPDSYLVQGRLDYIFRSPSRENMESLRARYEEFDSQFGRHLVNEKLDISIQEGRLLSSIRQLETEDPQPNWHAMLPPLRRVSSLRGEPLLETQDEEERDRHLGGSDAVELLDENTSPFQDEESTLMDLDNPEKKVEMTADNSRFSRESSIQLAQNRPDEGSFQKAAASFVESVMTISKGKSTVLDNTPPQPEVAGSGPARPSTPMQLPNILTELGSLGSLEAFLETRGFISDSPNSLSFSDIYGEDPSPTAAATPSTAFPDTIHELTLMSPPTVPQDNGQPTKELVLYLSSDLLKSHLPLVQSLETMPDPPQLVFRDYNAQEGVDDADIIIPPATGIILTTAQALTQRHLPGNRRHLDSPVLERIDRLAPRYEDFYVLASSGQTAAKRTVDAIDFLKSFCESISRTVTVTPLVVSSEKVVEWVLALAFEKGGTQ